MLGASINNQKRSQGMVECVCLALPLLISSLFIQYASSSSFRPQDNEDENKNKIKLNYIFDLKKNQLAHDSYLDSLSILSWIVMLLKIIPQ